MAMNNALALELYELPSGFRWYDFGCGSCIAPVPTKDGWTSGYYIGIERESDHAIQLIQITRRDFGRLNEVVSVGLTELSKQGTPDYLEGQILPCVTIPSASHSPQS